jgi:hypothetical protein
VSKDKAPSDLEQHLIQAQQILQCESSDSDSTESTTDDSNDLTDADSTKTTLRTAIQSLSKYVDMLMDLCPTLEQGYRDKHQGRPKHCNPIPSFQVTQEALPYVHVVRDKFPRADSSLVERLGEANWQRHERLRAIEGSGNQDITGWIPARASHPAKSQFRPISLFKDSALGSSIAPDPERAQSLASHSSFLSSNQDSQKGHFRVPKLPTEAAYGKPFLCPFCQQTVRSIKNRVDWKLHVFADLQAYICLGKDCPDMLKTFPSRKAWYEHESTHHFSRQHFHCRVCPASYQEEHDFLGHSFKDHGVVDNLQLRSSILATAKVSYLISPEDLQCPLCDVKCFSKHREFATHVGKHHEEIALCSLPPYGESDDDDAEVSSEDDAPSVDQVMAKEGEHHLWADSGEQNQEPQARFPVEEEQRQRAQAKAELFTASATSAAVDAAAAENDTSEDALSISSDRRDEEPIRRSRRRKAPVKYDDSLSEEEWLAVVESRDDSVKGAEKPQILRDKRGKAEASKAQGLAPELIHSFSEVNPLREYVQRYFCPNPKCTHKPEGYHKKIFCLNHIRSHHPDLVSSSGRPWEPESRHIMVRVPPKEKVGPLVAVSNEVAHLPEAKQCKRLRELKFLVVDQWQPQCEDFARSCEQITKDRTLRHSQLREALTKIQQEAMEYNSLAPSYFGKEPEPDRALENYQTQLMLLEHQHKKSLAQEVIAAVNHALLTIESIQLDLLVAMQSSTTHASQDESPREQLLKLAEVYRKDWRPRSQKFRTSSGSEFNSERQEFQKLYDEVKAISQKAHKLYQSIGANADYEVQLVLLEIQSGHQVFLTRQEQVEMNASTSTRGPIVQDHGLDVRYDGARRITLKEKSNAARGAQKPTHCYCDGTGQGNRIFCGNRTCPREWFHLECVGLKDKPKNEAWYCDDCVDEHEPIMAHRGRAAPSAKAPWVDGFGSSRDQYDSKDPRPLDTQRESGPSRNVFDSLNKPSPEGLQQRADQQHSAGEENHSRVRPEPFLTQRDMDAAITAAQAYLQDGFPDQHFASSQEPIEITTPSSSQLLLADRLSAARNDHLRSQPPTSDPPKRSPFRPNSPFRQTSPFD